MHEGDRSTGSESFRSQRSWLLVFIPRIEKSFDTRSGSALQDPPVCITKILSLRGPTTRSSNTGVKNAIETKPGQVATKPIERCDRSAVNRVSS